MADAYFSNKNIFHGRTRTNHNKNIKGDIHTSVCLNLKDTFYDIKSI